MRFAEKEQGQAVELSTRGSEDNLLLNQGSPLNTAERHALFEGEEESETQRKWR